MGKCSGGQMCVLNSAWDACQRAEAQSSTPSTYHHHPGGMNVKQAVFSSENFW